MDIIHKLQRNPKDIYQEASRLLIKIADNVLNNPSNQKVRTLQKSNKTIHDKILNVFGGIDCLLLMGFQDRNACLTLPPDASLEKLKEVKDDIIKYQKLYMENNGAFPKTNTKTVAEDEEPEEMITKIELAPFQNRYENKFLNNIAYHFHLAQIHDNKDLHERARKLIPMRQLEVNAQENLRALQKELKKGTIDNLEITIQDMLILELLNWFKNDFFSWVDSPQCEKCKAPTQFSHMCTDPEMLNFTDRVEMHSCQSCNALTAFPRYNDLNILMATRRGRCGEWANCFTLFCRAMGWDARQVFDQTDHTWTEVYSIGERRWLHCDPCENVCDTPLMYEAGWNKKVSYVLAYSGEEVQDVTWRYTSNHKNALSRRNLCSEDELIQVLIELRNERQKTLSDSRRRYLAKRVLEELCELLIEKQPSDKDKKGRISGSLAWRLGRGEQQLGDDFKPHVWKFLANDVVDNSINIKYCTAMDQYERCTHTKCSLLKEWHKGVFEADGVFRKEEKDWKMVYLARTEGSEIGKIIWTFEIDDIGKVFDHVDVALDYALYENGKVEIVVSGDSLKIPLSTSQKRLSTDQLAGSRRIQIEVVLSGGKGDVAWQHAQLFRQSTNAKDSCFDVTFTFKDV